MASVESHPVITLNPSRPTFLDLPLEIRRRIYTLSGLVRNCPLYLQVWTSSQRKWAIKAASCYDDKILCACLQNSHLPGLDCDCFLSDHGYEFPPCANLSHVPKGRPRSNRAVLLQQSISDLLCVSMGVEITPANRDRQSEIHHVLEAQLPYIVPRW